MRSTTLYFAGLLLCVTLLMPAGVSAQTHSITEEAYHDTLQNLIVLLQQQIGTLQAELRQRQTQDVVVAAPAGTALTETSFGETLTVTAAYPLTEPADVRGIAEPTHRAYYERVLELFPDEYDQMLGQVLVFQGTENTFDAFVETIPPDHKQWRYGTHEELLAQPYSDANTELIVHELAHIISYEKIPSVSRSDISNCHDYFDHHGCPAPGSYLSAFVDNFWTTADLNRAEEFARADDAFDVTYDYYESNEEEYVSDYAVLGPEEDFAESFMFFVLGMDPGGQDATAKVDFFSDYTKFKEVRAAINAAQ